MNKYVLSLAFVSQMLVFGQATATTNPFAKLAPKIEQHAYDWSIKVINTLNEELQLVLLNFFALNSEEKIQALIKCAEYLEKHSEILGLHEELANNIVEVINSYIQNIEKKMALKEMSDQEKETILQKLRIKIQELIAYINAIYYQTLYGQVSKRNKSLMFMFDENGFIPKEKRTQVLPETL